MSKNKYVLVVLVVFGIVAFASASYPIKIIYSKKLTITLNLNHFDENDSRVWKMRCRDNARFFNSGGPLFVYVSESEIEEDIIDYSHIHDMAEELGGYMVSTETRFYGESIPLADLSSKNLKYLNVDQILADLAGVISAFKSNIPGMKNSKVILCGKRFAGSYITWFKQRFPELVDVVWASSAPLEVKHNFFEYKEEAGQAIKMFGDSDCYNRIKHAFDELQSMIENKRGAEVKNKLHKCDRTTLDNLLDVPIVIGGLAITLSHSIFESIDIPSFCEDIMEESSDINAIAAHYNRNDDEEICWDFLCRSSGAYTKSGSYIASFLNETNHCRPYWYQACNELFLFPTSDSPDQPFGTKPSLEFFTTFCKNVFGTEYTIESVERKIRDFNERFGGRNPKVNNVFFTYGEYDPYRRLGIEDERKVTTVLNAGIGADMSVGVHYYNEPELTRAVSAFVREALKQKTE